MITIERLKEVTPDIVLQLERLGHDLHTEPRATSLEEVQNILNDETALLVVVKDGKKIIGMASVYIIPKIGNLTSYLEDVVVDSAYRGQGLGEKLVREAIVLAKQKGARAMSLTSRPARVAAHKLYEKIGFKKKETDVFKLSF